MRPRSVTCRLRLNHCYYILFTSRRVGYTMIESANLEAASPLVIFYKVVLVQDTGCGVHQIHPASLQQGV